MKFKCDAANLKYALTAVSDVIRSRNTVPILSYVMVSAVSSDKGGQVELCATNFDQEGRTFASAEVVGAGSVCVDAAKLRQLLGPLSGEVVFELGAGRAGGAVAQYLKVRCRRSYAELPTLPAEDLPLMPSDSETDPVAISAELLGNGLSRIAYAMANSESRFYLNGALFESYSAGLAITATDGHRLSSVYLPNVPWPHDPIIVPRDAVRDMIKFCGRAGKGVNVSLLVCGGDKVAIESLAERYLTKLVEGNFPDWRKSVPKNWLASCEIVPAALSNSISVVTALNEDKVSTVGLRASKGEGFELQTGEAGREARDALDMPVTLNGDGVDDQTAFFNAKYLRDAIAQIPSKSGVLYLHGSDQACVLESEDKDLTQVLMPLRGVWRE